VIPVRVTDNLTSIPTWLLAHPRPVNETTGSFVMTPMTRPAPLVRTGLLYGALKTAGDFTVALTLLILALPVLLVTALMVKVTSPGPVFYSQTRVGRGGRPFRIYKVRTMYHDCEATTGARWSSKHDPRVTPLGRILRKLHIDELPQLWNILRGDMSLVGPRPERPEFVTQLEKLIEGYAGRLMVKPGLTGLAQIQLPPDSNLTSVRNKLALDLVYVRRRGLWLDLRLLVATALYLVGFSYAQVRRAMRLPTAPDAPALLLDSSGTTLPKAVTPGDAPAPAAGRAEPQMTSI
jgi:lipopolysaccharide/colanic/teichoic acid biosynthesis glycosyltransferase